MHDLVVKDALIADGTGQRMFAGDVAVSGGRITEVGKVAGSARETIDAKGNVLSPGIIDVHTHYDAQLIWDATASPSPALGVTTVVIGNCGFSLAPAPRAVQADIIGDLAIVEAISPRALQEGVVWDFETFPEYMAMLRRRGTMPNVGAFVGHSTVRTAVMRDEASTRAATKSELEAMRDMVRGAMEAGAIGLATTQSMRAVGHRGLPMPSRLADENEFRALIGVLGELGHGVYMHTGTPHNPTSPDFLEELSALSGRPVIWASAIHRAIEPFLALRMLQFCAEARRRGHTMYAQTACHPMEHNFTLRNAFLFEGYDAWAETRGANDDKLLSIVRDTGFRDRFRTQLGERNTRYIFHGRWDHVTISEVAFPRNQPIEGLTVAEVAAQRGADPLDVFLDLAVDEELQTSFTALMLNADEGGVAGLLAHDSSLICLSDAGAHVAFMCRAGFGLLLFGHWARENGLFSLEEAVRRVTSMPADIYGIRDRGRIAAGAYADLLLFDPQTVGVSAPRRVNDFPGGETRVVCDPLGMKGVWVNGVRVAAEDGRLDPRVRPGHVGLTEATPVLT